MLKEANLLCPSCHSDQVEHFSEEAEKEFRCTECGIIFGPTQYNTPKVED